MRHDRAGAIISLENSGAFIVPIKIFIAEYRNGGSGGGGRKRSFTLPSTSIIHIVEIIKLYLCAQQMRARGKACSIGRGRKKEKKMEACMSLSRDSRETRGVISLIRHLS